MTASASSSVPIMLFGSRIAAKPSTKLPTPASSARLTAETLRRHNVGTKSNAATRRKCRDVQSQPSVTSSMGNINFIAFSSFLGDLQGQIFVFFVLTVAAAEAAIGLAILVILFRKLDTIRVDKLNKLKG